MYSVCTASLKLKLSQAGKSACAQHNHQLVKADDNFLAACRASDKKQRATHGVGAAFLDCIRPSPRNSIPYRLCTPKMLPLVV